MMARVLDINSMGSEPRVHVHIASPSYRDFDPDATRFLIRGPRVILEGIAMEEMSLESFARVPAAREAANFVPVICACIRCGMKKTARIKSGENEIDHSPNSFNRSRFRFPFPFGRSANFPSCRLIESAERLKAKGHQI